MAMLGFMAEDVQDKTEEATSKKLSDARKKGQVSKSQDLSVSGLLIASFIALWLFSPYMMSRITYLAQGIMSSLYEPYDTIPAISRLFAEGLTYIVVTMLPLLLFLLAATLGITIAQVGFLLAFESLKPKWKNLNIFNPERYKKFVDLSALVKLAFGLLKLTVVGVICYLMISGRVPKISQLMNATAAVIATFMYTEAMRIGLTIAFILLVLGFMELAYQKWKFSNDMKMSKQEVKDERKQTEGDPHVKGRMRSMMQQMMQSRMKDRVPHADVIIANPVHFAVALKYDADEMVAPVCLAKGARLMALQIKDLAKEHGVPIVENPPLARGLYKVVEAGEYVPPEFYQAVAEVLAYVYRLNDQVPQLVGHEEGRE